MSDSTKKLEKKMKIIDTAFSLFRKSSVNATAIDDIVKAAGIARGTFYLYFKDKSDLLEQIILYKSTEYMKEVLKNTLDTSVTDEKVFYDTLRHVLNATIDFLINNKEILPVINKNLSSCVKNLQQIFDKDILDFYTRAISLMVSFGYDREEAHKTIYIAFDMVGSVCFDAITTNKPYPIEELRETVIETVICIFKNNASLSRQKAELPS